MKDTLYKHIDHELELSEQYVSTGDYQTAFKHLERAHVLGQAMTYEHTRVHWRMFKIALKMRSPREIFGQIIRIVGASTKTPLGIYPVGNTGGANVWFFRPMPVPPDLQELLSDARRNS